MKYFIVTDDGIVVDLDEEMEKFMAKYSFPYVRINIMNGYIIIREVGLVENLILYHVESKKTYSLTDFIEDATKHKVLDIYNNQVLYSENSWHYKLCVHHLITKTTISLNNREVPNIHSGEFIDENHILLNWTGGQEIYQIHDRCFEKVYETNLEMNLGHVIQVKLHPCLAKKPQLNPRIIEYISSHKYEYQTSTNKQFIAFKDDDTQQIQVYPITDKVDELTTQKGMLN